MVCFRNENELQKELHCFEHAIYILYIINKRNRADAKLCTLGVDINCNFYRVLYNVWAG